MRRECNQSYWKFANRILDNDDPDPVVSPTFDAATADKYFKEIYSSQNHHYFQPSWLPSTAAPDILFDSDNIQLEEIPHCNYYLWQLILAIWKESLNIVLAKINCFRRNTAKQKKEVLFSFLFL